MEGTLMLPTRVLYYGADEPLPEQTELRAGPLTLVYEAGDLRSIRLGEREILRRVYVAIRDRNWGTVPSRLSNLRKEVGSDSFRIAYDAENRQGEIHLFWKGTIAGDATGTITFTMEGEARSTFLRNRIGFCVLHPIRECAGEPCVVEKVDGTTLRGAFPRYISPHQPFLDLRAIAHEIIPGVWAEVRFAGDIFEMEDQRNWSDASYKTYCTPLRLPFPAEIKAGTKVSQSVTLILKGKVPEVRAESRGAAVLFTVGQTPPTPLPRIGLGVASYGQPLTPKELARLKALNLSHLRVDLNLFEPQYSSVLRRANKEARALGVPLEIALTLSDRAVEELVGLTGSLEGMKPEVCTWLVFHAAEKSTSEKWVKLARSCLAGYNPKAKIGGGANAYFAELNRGRPPVNVLDIASFSINPQVHATDNASLVENLEAQGATVESARQFLGGLPVAVTPITLKPRFNPNATVPEPEPAAGELPAQVDARQTSLFGAAWTTGSLKYLAESAAYSMTYYETSGWRGVMETQTGSSLPEKFRSLAGSVFPLYHVLADAGEFRAGGVVVSTSSAPLQVDGLVLREDRRTRILLANLGAEPRHVRVVNANLGAQVRVKHLDETNAETAMQSPESFRAELGSLIQSPGGSIELLLRPYALARIDSSTPEDR
jgi:hypothetical protein